MAWPDAGGSEILHLMKRPKEQRTCVSCCFPSKFIADVSMPL